MRGAPISYLGGGSAPVLSRIGPVREPPHHLGLATERYVSVADEGGQRALVPEALRPNLELLRRLANLLTQRNSA